MHVLRPAADESAAGIDSRPRYWRDWLIAAGSVIFVIGPAFPFYLAWRDNRRKWAWACSLLVLAGMACLPLSAANETIASAAFLAVWLVGIAVAIVLAATVPPEHRRASAKDLAARRHAARRTRSLVRRMSRAAIEPGWDLRPRGGTVLSEPIVLITGAHRSAYVFYDPDDRLLGVAEPTDSCPPPYRARYELVAPDGSRLLAMDIAQRSGRHEDVILAGDDTELVRLQPAAPDDGSLPHTAHPAPWGRLGLGPRWLLSGGERIGQVHRSDKGRPPTRVITDAGGAEVARVVRVGGGAGPTGTGREFVVDVSDRADDRIRAAALLVGVLWDWYIISWDAGGG